VQHKFLDAMNAGKRLGRSRSGIDILQQLKQSRTMPGIAFEGAPKLVGDQGGFGT